jgi:hypothetical protein
MAQAEEALEVDHVFSAHEPARERSRAACAHERAEANNAFGD